MMKLFHARSSAGNWTLTAASALALAAVAAVWIGPDIARRTTTTRCSKVKADIRAIVSGLVEYRDVHGRYPADLEELWRPDEGGRSFMKGRQPVLDSWKRPYHYVCPVGRHRGATVYTLGSDGELGGDGYDVDVSNLGEGDEAGIVPVPR